MSIALFCDRGAERILIDMFGGREFARLHPGVFFLDLDHPAGIEAYLRRRGWIGEAERVVGAEPAGPGNMNCVLRVQTSDRTFVLKQSRPWAEKYSDIPAPWDRARIEGAFYREIQSDAALAAHMPRLLGFDPEARLLMLEDLSPARDLTGVYDGEPFEEADIGVLTHFLLTLHCNFSDGRLSDEFANREMCALNHERIFVFPLRSGNGFDLDAITPGLNDAARTLRSDAPYRERVSKLGELYLGPGFCLLHGDYFPGSWLKTANGMRVIDPEFCSFGMPEFDVGVMTAHLHLARAPQALIEDVHKIYTARAPLDRPLTQRFAGVEIMRRLMGVAQLPLSYGLDQKRRLLDLSHALVMGA
jgi:5-methylthioribose kinase